MGDSIDEGQIQGIRGMSYKVQYLAPNSAYKNDDSLPTRGP